MKCSSSSLCLCGAFSCSAAMPSLASLFLLLLSFLSLPFVSAATSFEECLSQTRCGNLNISYPFGIDDQGCGDPDFQIHGCDLDDPYITMNETKLYVLHIENNWSSPEIEIKISVESDCFDFSKLQSEALKYGSEFNFTYTDAAASLVEVINCSTNLSDKSLGWWSLCSSWYIFFGLNPSPYEEYCYEQSLVKMTIKWTESDFKTNGKKILEDKGIWVLGKVLNERQSNCSKCEETGGICGYYTSNHSFACVEPPGPSPSKKSNTPKIIGAAVGVAGVALIGSVILLLIFRRRKAANFRTDDDRNRRGNYKDLESTKSKTEGSELFAQMNIFSYEELSEATAQFAEENELGDGGFGSVFRGKLQDGRTVAVKRLYQHHSRRTEKFLNEALVYTKLHHPHVVRLYGCTSPRSSELMLVFEFVPNGTLADHLHGDWRCPGGLPWDRRLKIAIQTAEALAFLHGMKPPVFHRDVKSSNILLTEHFDAKVADFGLCRPLLSDVSHVTTAPQGTPGYVDPEYHECYQLTEKSDVYSYGVVLVEIISGQVAVDVNRDRRYINLANMAVSMIQAGNLTALVDGDLLEVMGRDSKVADGVRGVAEVAFRCLSSQREDRPSMADVVDLLQSLRDQYYDDVDRKAKGKGNEPLSPTSVHDKWQSISSTPNVSADS